MDNLEKLEKNYDLFYEETIDNINIVFFYINNNELEKIRQENIDINDGVLAKDQLIYIINDNKHILKTKYYLSGILKYNVSLNPKEILEFLKTEDKSKYSFLQKLKSVDDIYFKDTITMFNDYNSLYIFFNKTKPSKDSTRRASANRARTTKKNNLKR